MLSIQTLSGKRLKKENPVSSNPRGELLPAGLGLSSHWCQQQSLPSTGSGQHECSFPTLDLTEDHQKVPPAPTWGEVLLLPEAAFAQPYLQDQSEHRVFGSGNKAQGAGAACF